MLQLGLISLSLDDLIFRAFSVGTEFARWLMRVKESLLSLENAVCRSVLHLVTNRVIGQSGRHGPIARVLAKKLGKNGSGRAKAKSVLENDSKSKSAFQGSGST